MGKFVKNISVTIIAGIFLLFGLDVLYTKTYKNAPPRNKIAYLLSIQNKKIDYIFLGSSRTNNHIDTAVIEEVTGGSAINLGLQGAEIDDYLLLLKLLQRQGITSETILIQMDYQFNQDRPEASKYVKSNLIPYIADAQIAEFIKQRDPDFKLLRYIPFYKYLAYDFNVGFREFFATLISQKPRVNFENGFSKKIGNDGRMIPQHLPPTVAEKNSTIDQINEFASTHGMDVQYFMAPYCAKTTNLDFGEKLEQKIPGLMNYTTLYVDQDRFFYNCSHLNSIGAKEFSEVIANDIQKLN